MSGQAIKSARVPQTWCELADAIGPAAALALSAAYGGVNIYVPSRMHRSHAIARLFDAAGAGYGAALALAELHGDTTLAVPQLSAFWRIRKAASALEMLHAGASMEEVAQQMGVSKRTVLRTLEFARLLSLNARLRRDRYRRMGALDVVGDNAARHAAAQLPLFPADGQGASCGEASASATLQQALPKGDRYVGQADQAGADRERVVRPRSRGRRAAAAGASVD